jgi:nicotinate-nucleotide pyrophosphorylase (carboxylating)
MSIPRLIVSQIVTRALEEDLGRGDLTTEACVAENAVGAAALVAREAAVFCGGELVREVYAQLDSRVSVTLHCADGDKVQPGSQLLQLQGPARSLLEGERVALNFCQRMSGVATLTRAYVDAVPAGCKTRIVDTRKTTPGLRALERHAVRAGRGHNHREDLGAAVLIKDNHIAAAGGVGQAIDLCRARSAHTSRIECEVDTLQQLEVALAHKADIVLLDNFDDKQLERAIQLIDGRAIVEVSGGIKLERVATIARLGVDVISVGALTHSARAIDLGLDWTGAS